MVPEMSRLVRRVAFLLVALAAAAVEIAAIDTRPVAASLGLASVGIALAALAGRFVRVPTDPQSHPPKWVFVVLFGLAAAPFIVEPLRRDWTGDGYAFELQMVFGLRNVGLGLAVVGGWFLCLRLACVVSLFLILFAAAMTNHPAVMVILGLYTAVGSFWLVLAYWTGLKAVFVASERAVAVELLAERQRIPWAALVLLVLTVTGGVALAVVGPKRASYALGELLPTSGGDRGHRPVRPVRRRGRTGGNGRGRRESGGDGRDGQDDRGQQEFAHRRRERHVRAAAQAAERSGADGRRRESGRDRVPRQTAGQPPPEPRLRHRPQRAEGRQEAGEPQSPRAVRGRRADTASRPAGGLRELRRGGQTVDRSPQAGGAS